MSSRARLAALLALTLPGPLRAQSPDSTASPFRPLALPAPNLVRTGAGRPGRGTGNSG